MRKLVFLVLLAGCAQQPTGPTSQQLAMWSYFANLCGYRGDNVALAIRTDPALKGCVTQHAIRADAEYRRKPNVLEESGNVLMAPATKSQQNCTTRPDYMGGWITNCY